jgi:hypothetical protein
MWNMTDVSNVGTSISKVAAGRHLVIVEIAVSQQCADLSIPVYAIALHKTANIYVKNLKVPTEFVRLITRIKQQKLIVHVVTCALQ